MTSEQMSITESTLEIKKQEVDVDCGNAIKTQRRKVFTILEDPNYPDRDINILPTVRRPSSGTSCVMASVIWGLILIPLIPLNIICYRPPSQSIPVHT